MLPRLRMTKSGLFAQLEEPSNHNYSIGNFIPAVAVSQNLTYRSVSSRMIQYLVWEVVPLTSQHNGLQFAFVWQGL